MTNGFPHPFNIHLGFHPKDPEVVRIGVNNNFFI